MPSNFCSSLIKNARVSTASFRSRSSDGGGPSAGRADAARLFFKAANSQPTKTKRTKTQAEKNNGPQYSVAKRPDICLRPFHFVTQRNYRGPAAARFITFLTVCGSHPAPRAVEMIGDQKRRLVRHQAGK